MSQWGFVPKRISWFRWGVVSSKWDGIPAINPRTLRRANFWTRRAAQKFADRANEETP